MNQSYQDYSTSSCSHHNQIKELLKKLGVLRDKNILDIGCGDGRVTAEMAQKSIQGSVVGLDIDSKFVEFARNKFPSTSFPNLGRVIN